MTSEEINTAQPPEIILKYAYEYKLKEDIYYLWGIKIWRIFRQNHYKKWISPYRKFMKDLIVKRQKQF